MAKRLQMSDAQTKYVRVGDQYTNAEVDQKVLNLKNEMVSLISTYVKNANKVIDEAMLTDELVRKVNYLGAQAAQRHDFVTDADFHALEAKVSSNAISIKTLRDNLGTYLTPSSTIYESQLDSNLRTKINSARQNSTPLSIADFNDAEKNKLYNAISNVGGGGGSGSIPSSVINNASIGDAFYSLGSGETTSKPIYRFSLLAVTGQNSVNAWKEKIKAMWVAKAAETMTEEQELYSLAKEIFDIQTYTLYTLADDNVTWDAGTHETKNFKKLVGQLIGNPVEKSLYYVAAEDTFLGFMDVSKSIDIDAVKSCIDFCFTKITDTTPLT